MTAPCGRSRQTLGRISDLPSGAAHRGSVRSSRDAVVALPEATANDETRGFEATTGHIGELSSWVLANANDRPAPGGSAGYFDVDQF